jgi:hypothetical protein
MTAAKPRPPAKKAAAKKAAPKKPTATTPRIQPRHEILGVAAGMPGYRRQCRCQQCIGANRERVRQYRATKAATAPAKEAAVQQPPAPPAAPSIPIKELPPGAVSSALELDLKKVDGAYVFQDTVTAMLRMSARILDNVDVLDRIDMTTSLQIRILDGLKRLEPPRGKPTTGADQVEKIIAAITGATEQQ